MIFHIHVLTWAKKSGDANQLWKITDDGEIENIKTSLILDSAPDGTKVSSIVYASVI